MIIAGKSLIIRYFGDGTNIHIYAEEQMSGKILMDEEPVETEIFITLRLLTGSEREAVKEYVKYKLLKEEV